MAGHFLWYSHFNGSRDNEYFENATAYDVEVRSEILARDEDAPWFGEIEEFITAPTYDIVGTRETPLGDVTLVRVAGVVVGDHSELDYEDCPDFPCVAANVEAIYGFANWGAWAVGWSDVSDRAQGPFAPGGDTSQRGQGHEAKLQVFDEEDNFWVQVNYGRGPFDPDGTVEFAHSGYLHSSEIVDLPWSATYNGLMAGLAHTFDDRPVTGDVAIQASFHNRGSATGHISGDPDLTSIDISMTNIAGDGFSLPEITFPTIDGNHSRAPYEPPHVHPLFGVTHFEGTGSVIGWSFRLDHPDYWVDGSFGGGALQQVDGLFPNGDVTGAFGALRTEAKNLPPTEPYTPGTGQR